MRPRYRSLHTTIAVLFLLSLGTIVSAQSGEETEEINDRAEFRRPTEEILALEGELRQAVESRSALGFSADPALVTTYLDAETTTDSLLPGIPLTTEETDEMTTRMAFMAEANETVVPFVKELPTFGGAYFDHQADGRLVVLLTEVDDTTQNDILALAPSGQTISVEQVNYTETQLRDALPKAWEIWRGLGGPQAYSIAVDTPANAIRIDVDPDALEAAEKLVSEVTDVLKVPVFIGIGEQPTDTSCSGREDCTDPMRAGTIVRSNSGKICTMGFHIRVGTDEQFLTAGHCGYSSSENWNHAGYGFIGTAEQTLYPDQDRDIMTIDIPDDQDSNKLYTITDTYADTGSPILGGVVCADLGRSDVFICGTVQDDFASWISSNCNCVVYGADSSLNTIPGDSGSPIVASSANNSFGLAVGISNTANGQFAIVEDALDTWGYRIR